MTALAPSRGRILLVDDEPADRHSYARRLGDAGFEVITAPGGAEALQLLAGGSFDIVLSAISMPAMDGLEFLKALHAIQPDCMRLVLSGQTDMAALVEMINQTHIFRFIPKPWSSYFLKSSIKQAIDLRTTQLANRRMAKALRSIIHENKTVKQAMEVFHDAKASGKKVMV